MKSSTTGKRKEPEKGKGAKGKGGAAGGTGFASRTDETALTFALWVGGPAARGERGGPSVVYFAQT